MIDNTAKPSLALVRYIAIDTGGLSGDEEGIDFEMAEQSLQAVEEADAVLFMVDAKEGLSPGDESIGAVST